MNGWDKGRGGKMEVEKKMDKGQVSEDESRLTRPSVTTSRRQRCMEKNFEWLELEKRGKDESREKNGQGTGQ